MPVILRKQIFPNINIAIWQITETEDCLLHSLQLCPEDKANLSGIKLPQVRLQKLACRAALAELLGSNEIGITYSETGQPQIKDHYISFSHTKNIVAAVLADMPVGIDIEELSPRIVPLYPRFMSREEIAACNPNNLQDLYYYWCAKEAMYKWYAAKNLDFIEDLQVYKNEDRGVVCKTHTVQLSHISFDNLSVVVCGLYFKPLTAAPSSFA